MIDCHRTGRNGAAYQRQTKALGRQHLPVVIKKTGGQFRSGLRRVAVQLARQVGDKPHCLRHRHGTIAGHFLHRIDGAIAVETEPIIKAEPQPQCQARRFLMVIARHDKGQRMHQMFGHSRPMTAFAQTFAYQPHLAIGQIAQAAMHQFGRTGRGRTAKITLINDGDAKPTQRCVKGDGRTGCAAANNGKVESVGAESVEIALHNVFKTGFAGVEIMGSIKQEKRKGARKWLSQTPMG